MWEHQLHRHLASPSTLSLHVEAKEADYSIDLGLELGCWMLQEDSGARELWVTGESYLNHRNRVLSPLVRKRGQERTDRG